MSPTPIYQLRMQAIVASPHMDASTPLDANSVSGVSPASKGYDAQAGIAFLFDPAKDYEFESNSPLADDGGILAGCTRRGPPPTRVKSLFSSAPRRVAFSVHLYCSRPHRRGRRCFHASCIPRVGTLLRSPTHSPSWLAAYQGALQRQAKRWAQLRRGSRRDRGPIFQPFIRAVARTIRPARH